MKPNDSYIKSMKLLNNGHDCRDEIISNVLNKFKE